MPSFAHRTLEELPTNAQENVTTGKQQEEGFAGGLPARNARMFRVATCPRPRAWCQPGGGCG